MLTKGDLDKEEHAGLINQLFKYCEDLVEIGPEQKAHLMGFRKKIEEMVASY